jgi:hypothetical protein
MRISLTDPLDLEAETEDHPEPTEDQEDEILEHVGSFVDFMLANFPVCPTRLLAYVEGTLDAVAGAEDMDWLANAPGSYLTH